MMQSYKKIALYQTFFLVILLILFDATLVMGGGPPNICSTYSCGACCTQDTRPCCNPGWRPGLRADIPIQRTFSKSGSAMLSGITITEADITTLMDVGKSHQTFAFNSTTDELTMNIGIADAVNAQSWVIPNNVLSLLPNTLQLDFIAAANVPAAITALHPNVSYWAKETITRGGVDYTSYKAMWLNPASHIDLVAVFHVRNSDGAVFENAGISGNVTNVDMNLGDNFWTYSAYAEPNNTNFNNYSNGTITLDGYGTISTPYGTFNCLRGSFEMESQLYDNATGFGVGTPETSHWVVWLTKEGFRFYARKPNQSASGDNVVLKNIMMTRVVPTTVLPIELLQFSAKRQDNQTVTISWKTASEKDNATFEVQRTSDGKNFETIGTVRGAINSAQMQSYQLVDNTPSVGHNYYRLRQTDTNGNETFSPLEYVWIKPEKGFLNIYPNPVSDILNIEFEQAKEMTITDAAGKTVKVIPIENGHLLQKQTISIQDLPTGVYFLQANIKGENKTLQFVKK